MERMRLSVHLARRASRLEPMVRWRRRIQALSAWIAKTRASVCIEEALRTWQIRYRNGLVSRWNEWRAMTSTSRRQCTWKARMRRLFAHNAVIQWRMFLVNAAGRRENRIVLSATTALARDTLTQQKLAVSIDTWFHWHERERARRARLEGRCHLFLSERGHALLGASWGTWSHRAHLTSRANRWLTLAEGHHILVSMARACARWRHVLHDRSAAIAARPSPPRDGAKPYFQPCVPPPVAVPTSRSPSPPNERSFLPPRASHGDARTHSRSPLLGRHVAGQPELSLGDLLDRMVVVHQLLEQAPASTDDGSGMLQSSAEHSFHCVASEQRPASGSSRKYLGNVIQRVSFADGAPCHRHPF